jgi:hypothetical protein
LASVLQKQGRSSKKLFKRNDAAQAGAQGKYLKVTTPKGMATRQESNVTGDVSGSTGRDFMVGPVKKADERPFIVKAKGKRRGSESFATEEEARAFAEGAGFKKFSIEQQPQPEGYGIYELNYRKDASGNDELVGKRVVNTYASEQEANEAIKEYDPAYSPESNRWKRRRTEQEKEQTSS